MAVGIRLAEAEDLAALRLIFDYGYAFHRVAQPTVFRSAEDYRGSDEFLLACMVNPQAALLLAEREGQAAGLAYVLERSAPDIYVLAPRRYAVLDTLAVLPDAQRAGVGKALLARVEVWALERGLVEIELGVWEFNEHARAMYRGAGYETARRTMIKSLCEQPRDCSGTDESAK